MKKRRNSVSSIITFQNNYFLKCIEIRKPNKNKPFKFKYNYKTHLNPESYLYNYKGNSRYNTIYNSGSKSKDIEEKIQKKEFRKKKLASIDLFEKNTKNIYDWNILLNYPNPGSYYNKKDYKILEEQPMETKTKNNLPKYPVILVDLNDNQIKKYFGKSSLMTRRNYNYSLNTKKYSQNSQNFSFHSLSVEDSKKNKNKSTQKRTLTQSNNKLNISKKNSLSHNIRPISIYSTRKPEETFYFSNAFSDYYKEDLKTFSEKMPILKAKIKTSNKKLKREMMKQRIKSSKEEKIISNMLKKDNLVFKKSDLIIAGERKNAGPLLKSIYCQLNPKLKKIKGRIKLYYKTMKPYGNSNEKIDYTKNDRWKPSKEIKSLREKEKQYINVGTTIDNYDFIHNNKNNNKYIKKKSQLILSYYDNDDPDIKFFDYLINKHNNKTLNENYNTNYNDNDYNSFNDKDKVKEKIYLSSYRNKKVDNK